MVRVLTIAPDFGRGSGGIAAFVRSVCTELTKRRHRVDVLTPYDNRDSEESLPNVTFYPTQFRPSSLMPTLLTAQLHLRNHYEIVFLGNMMTTHALGALALRKLWEVPYVILCHGNDLRYSVSTWVDAPMARWLIQNATLMLANSRSTAERIRNTGYDGPMEILNPGVDPSRFHPDADTTAIRQMYGLDGHRVLLTVGRLVERKNVQGVLHALRQVVDQVPNLVYLIAGDGDQRKSLESLTEQLNLRSHVRFLGRVEDDLLPSLYCAADLFTMPSVEREGSKDYEGFGIVFVEANACGLPVIGGRSGGTEDAVVHEETGLLVDPHDVDEIAAAIVRLLTDQDLACRLGENGRRRVEREFTWKKVGARLEQILHSVISGEW